MCLFEDSWVSHTCIHCFLWEAVRRVERGRGRGCGRQKKFPEMGGKKKRALKSCLWGAGWEGCGTFVGCTPHRCPALGHLTLIITMVRFFIFS